MTKSLLSSLIFSDAANLGLKAEIKENNKRTQHNTVFNKRKKVSKVYKCCQTSYDLNV